MHNTRDFQPAAGTFGIYKVITSAALLIGVEEMSKKTYPLKLPSSIKNAAADLAKLDGVSLNQLIAAAVAE